MQYHFNLNSLVFTQPHRSILFQA
ncbi:hypothetical protein NC651_030973 [Populus alba x Populus x berolinensis]|nr:hypothetical protein NC651_030973 [Populus alba x Populus x berolinensis]